MALVALAHLFITLTRVRLKKSGSSVVKREAEGFLGVWPGCPPRL
jgi:hypothetical protein